ncbi:MAG: ATP-binding cassette, subfamily bacterial, partial [Acidobacteriota bacterium]|nr:ATP-binding cassette, subfamily bacterial [Acidobacteriota bacterium]
IGVNARFQRSLSGMNRIFQMMDLPTEFFGEEQTADSNAVPFKGDIRFEGVSFSYKEDREVLKDINLNINAGELLAIVGRSGAGKTTLVNLLPRLYEPGKGVIRLDGVNLRDIPKKQLREVIGFVSQDTFLFEGSIMDNIRFANPTASDGEIEAVIHATGIDVFLQRLSLDMKTDVGVLGTKLSGGQKQLIAIARALVKNPSILILDEATAHMDFETEHLLKSAISNAVKNRTTIMIAHRLTTVLNADKIMAMDNGQIVGLGTHQYLYQENPFYKEIFDRQFLDNSN